jgi:hypothetical protein
VSRTAVGYPRTCLWLGHDDPSRISADTMRDAIKRGEAIVTGGLYLSVVGPGGVRPGGSVLDAAGKLAFEVTVAAPGWIDAETLEVIVDGQTVQTISLSPSVTPGPGRRWEAPIEVEVPAGARTHWVVFHASSVQDLSPVYPGRHPFALSNPIFF